MLDMMKGHDEAAAAVVEDVTMEGDDEETQKEKAKLKAFIKQAEDWQMDATAAVKKLKELEAKQPVKLQIAASVAAKDLLAEKKRIIKEHEVKRRTLTEKGDKAKADQSKYEKGHKAAKDEELERTKEALHERETAMIAGS